jgi:peptidyl-prolyl cis-trans isomerase C
MNSPARLPSVLLAVLLGAGATSPAATTNSALSKIDQLLGDPVIARGKNVEVKRSQLDAELLNVRAQLAQQGRTATPAELQMVEAEKLTELVAFQILLKQATDADRTEGRARFEKLLKRLKTENKLSDAEFDEKLAAQVKLQGLTRADWDKQRIDQATVGVVLERELKVNISDADARKYYDENPARFEQPEQVRASHILISTKDPVTGGDLSDDKKPAKKKEIEDLRKRAVGGEDFAALARQYSEDPGSKDSGGEYTFARGRMVPPFEAAAFSLQTNQISDVVTTSYGYHIIKLIEKLPAKMLGYAEVSDDLKDAMRSKQLQEKLRETKYVQNLLVKNDVEIMDAKLKQLIEQARTESGPPGAPN